MKNYICIQCGSKIAKGNALLCQNCVASLLKEGSPANWRRIYELYDTCRPEFSGTFSDRTLSPVILSYFSNLSKKNSKILEIGAGGGYLSGQLYNQGFKQIVTVDFTATACRQIKNRQLKLKIVQADANILPFKEASFDYAISVELWEHLKRPIEHLLEVRRVLKNGGKYIIQTPNKMVAGIYFRLFCRNPGDLYIWHPSMSNLKEIRQVFKDNGFSIRITHPQRILEYQLKKIPNYLGLRSGLAKLPLRIIPSALLPSFTVIATKE